MLPTRFTQKPHDNIKSWDKQKFISSPYSLLLFLLIFLTIVYNILTYGVEKKDNIYKSLVIGDVANFPIHILDDFDGYLTPRKNSQSCTHFNCFNAYKCGIRGNKLLVYVYPPENFIDSSGRPVKSNGPMSKEFYQILKSITFSKFYTPNPKEACIFVPSIDTLNQNHLQLAGVSEALKTLKFWNNGENHLIFNMIPGSVPDFNTSLDVDAERAMIIGAGFSTLTYRNGFDISIPIFSPLAEVLKINNEKRTRLLISSHVNINQGFQQDIIEISSELPESVLMLGPCLHHNPMSNSIRCQGEKVFLNIYFCLFSSLKYLNIMLILFSRSLSIQMCYKHQHFASLLVEQDLDRVLF